MPAARRLFPSTRPGRLVPVGDGVGAGQPPRDVAAHDIEHKLRLGAIWALGAQVAVQVIRFASVVVLARLLTPGDYGAANIAVTLGSFAAILGDLGFGNALVQSSSATQRWASTAYWSALAAGLVGSGLAALGAYPASLVLGEPEVTGLVIVGGFTLFLVAAGSASNALLTRSMSFGVIQSAMLAATLIAAIAAIAAAAAGLGAWALVIQQVVLAGMTSVLFIVAGRWRPSLEFSRPAFNSLAKFALPITGGHLFAVVQPLVTALLIGHHVGVNELGIWSLSMSVVVVPLSLFGYPIGAGGLRGVRPDARYAGAHRRGLAERLQAARGRRLARALRPDRRGARHHPARVRATVASAP